MAFSGDQIGDELLQSVNRAFASLPDLLDALMRALASRLAPRGGSLRVRGVGTLVIGHHGGETISDWLSEPPPPAAGSIDAIVGAQLAPAVPPPPGGSALDIPITYADHDLGMLRLDMAVPPAPDDPVHDLLRHFARHCGLLVKRYEVRRWSQERLGRPLMLVGMSAPLRAIERFLEIASRGALPVLLRGEFGTEKAQLAAAIHCSGPGAAGPFVQVDCWEPEGSPGAWVHRAEGGTLFLGDIDELDPRLQKQLPQYLPSRTDQWLPAAPQQVRVIASTTADLHQRARDGIFSRALLAELDYLSATIPPLRDRREDIDALVCQAIARNGYRIEDKRTDALVALCRAHDWPENLFELERVIARLAVMTEGRPIDDADVRRFVPAMAAADADDDDEFAAPADADTWVRAAIDGDVPAGLHDALVRAILHLGRHSAEPITLPQLAWHAGVSASHLGYLFRTGIGMSFKALLGRIRIRRAQALLKADGRLAVTEAALSVGFADLSHFERSFRRIVGQAPSAYRKAEAGR